MSKTKSKISILFFLVSSLPIFSFSMFKYYSSISLYIMLLFSLLIIFLNDAFNIRSILFFLVATIYCFIALLYSKGGIGSLITFLLQFLMVFAFEKVSFSPKDKKLIRLICKIIFLYLFIKSFIYAKNWDYYRWNDINPNSMSQYLFFSYIFINSFDTSSGFLRRFVLFAAMIVAFLNYESRAICVSALICFIGFVFIKFMSYKRLKFVLFLFLLISLVFPFIYILLYSNKIEISFLSKNLFTGREIIWTELFNRLNASVWNWVFGIGSNVALWNGTMNVHNNTFAVIADFGVLGFLIFYVFVFNRVGIFNVETRENKMLLIGWICSAIILGITEVTTMWTDTYLFVFMMFGLASKSNISNKVLLKKITRRTL